jgi:phage terminase small subunit
MTDRKAKKVPETDKAARPLTAKQQAFVETYLLDLNATQATIRAGYSKQRASEIGYQLLQKTTVQQAIQAAFLARSQRTEITQDFVLSRLREEATTKMGQAGPRVRALELLGKHLGLFPDRIRHGGDDDAPPIHMAHSAENLSDADRVTRLAALAQRVHARTACQDDTNGES